MLEIYSARIIINSGLLLAPLDQAPAHLPKIDGHYRYSTAPKTLVKLPSRLTLAIDMPGCCHLSTGQCTRVSTVIDSTLHFRNLGIHCGGSVVFCYSGHSLSFAANGSQCKTSTGLGLALLAVPPKRRRRNHRMSSFSFGPAGSIR